MHCRRMYRRLAKALVSAPRRCLALSVLASSGARAADAPDCAAEIKAIVDRRYRHWLMADMQGALGIASDSVVIRIDTVNRIRFFDGARYGAQMRQCDRLAELAARNVCFTDLRAEVAAPSRRVVEAAVRLRDHNETGPSADSGTAARLRRACSMGFWVIVPYNRGGLVSAKFPEEKDPSAAVCMGGASFVSDWRNWTYDGGRSWSLMPNFGWCPSAADSVRIPPPPPSPPPTLQHAPSRRTL